MIFSIYRVDFIDAGLEDIRFLYQTWDELVSLAGQRYSDASLVTVAVATCFRAKQ